MDDTEAWHATSPRPVAGDPALANALFGDLAPLHQTDWELAAMTREERNAHEQAQHREHQTTLVMFSALELAHQEVEAQAMASIDSALGTGEAGDDWGEGMPAAATEDWAAAVDGAGAESPPEAGDGAAEFQAGAEPSQEFGDANSESLAGAEPAHDFGDGATEPLSGATPSHEFGDGASEFQPGAELPSYVGDGASEPLQGAEPSSEFGDGASGFQPGTEPSQEFGDANSESLQGAEPSSEFGDGASESLAGAEPASAFGDEETQPGAELSPGVGDVEAEIRAETERLAQLEIDAALAREHAELSSELSPPVGGLAWTEEPVSQPSVRPAGAAPQLGDEGFFDVDTPGTPQEAVPSAEQPFAAVSAESPSWMELPPDPEMENTARMAVRWAEPVPSVPVDTAAAPQADGSWDGSSEQGSEWGTEAELGTDSLEAGPDVAPQTPGESGKAAWDAAARSEEGSEDGDLAASDSDADAVPSAWDVLEAELQAAVRAREAEEAGLSPSETARPKARVTSGTTRKPPTR
ncbi:hypothetical protein ACLESD_24890 [Pyxidicoccus sp. 3LFB2]